MDFDPTVPLGCATVTKPRSFESSRAFVSNSRAFGPRDVRLVTGWHNVTGARRPPVRVHLHLLIRSEVVDDDCCPHALDFASCVAPSAPYMEMLVPLFSGAALLAAIMIRYQYKTPVPRLRVHIPSRSSIVVTLRSIYSTDVVASAMSGFASTDEPPKYLEQETRVECRTCSCTVRVSYKSVCGSGRWCLCPVTSYEECQSCTRDKQAAKDKERAEHKKIHDATTNPGRY